MSRRLFVGNVNPGLGEEQLVEFFSDAGEPRRFIGHRGGRHADGELSY